MSTCPECARLAEQLRLERLAHVECDLRYAAERMKVDSLEKQAVDHPKQIAVYEREVLRLLRLLAGRGEG